MNMKERIERFNHENRPFYIVDHDGGQFSLCLPLDFLDDEFENYGQAAFDAYALEIGEPPINRQGFQTHGNGYEWEAAFCQAFADDPNIDKILFDCESGGFFCYTADLSLLEDFAEVEKPFLQMIECWSLHQQESVLLIGRNHIGYVRRILRRECAFLEDLFQLAERHEQCFLP